MPGACPIIAQGIADGSFKSPHNSRIQPSLGGSDCTFRLAPADRRRQATKAAPLWCSCVAGRRTSAAGGPFRLMHLFAESVWAKEASVFVCEPGRDSSSVPCRIPRPCPPCRCHCGTQRRIKGPDEPRYTSRK